MSEDRWFIVFLAVVFAALLFLRFRRDLPSILARARKTPLGFLVPTRSALAIFRRSLGDFRRLGPWIATPLVFAAWTQLRPLFHYLYLKGKKPDLPGWNLKEAFGIEPSWEGLTFARTFMEAGTEMEAAFRLPVTTAAGFLIMLLLLPLAWAVAGAGEEGRERRSGAALAGLWLLGAAGLGLCAFSDFLLWVHLPRAFGENLHLPAQIFFSLAAPVFFALWFVLGAHLLGRGLGLRPVGSERLYPAWQRTLPVLWLIFFISSLPVHLTSVFTTLAHFRVDIPAWVYLSVRSVGDLLCILVLPLVMAVAVNEWNLTDVRRYSLSFYERRKGLLLSVIPLYWIPFFLLALLGWLMTVLVTPRDPGLDGSLPPLHPAAGESMLVLVLAKVFLVLAISVLSLLPLAYLFRVALRERKRIRAAEQRRGDEGEAGED
jgi:hypothetical protein